MTFDTVNITDIAFPFGLVASAPVTVGGLSVPEIVAALADEFDARHGGGSWRQTWFTGTVGSPQFASVEGATLAARVGYTYTSPAFELYEDDSAGWTSFVFSVKKNLSDVDGEEVLLARVSNPSDVADGLIRRNGRAAAGHAEASIDVLIVDGKDTSITVNFSAVAMNLAPSIDRGYPFTLVRWRGAEKKEIANGVLSLSRTTLNSPVVP